MRADDLSHPAPEDLDMLTVLTAMADPVRLAIMRVLFRGQGPIDGSAVAANIDLTPATMSHHWRVREAGLTVTTKRGRTRQVEVCREDLDVRFPGLLQATLATS